MAPASTAATGSAISKTRAVLLRFDDFPINKLSQTGLEKMSNSGQ
jgi:hypothetical protein